MEMRLEDQLNHNPPHLMHIDLNSCFATIEQQANPLLRDKPMGVVPFMSPNAVIIAPSIEAKKLGIKTGFSLREARVLCKGFIAKLADPRKYRDVHIKFRNIFKDYTPNVYPKSIDEAILDFSNTRLIYGKRTLMDIGKEIKQRMKEDIGEWIVCSVGISTNLMLAKLAASLHKPDGLDVIDHTNIFDIYKRITLTDFPGIAERYQSRLNVYRIFTPMQFLQTTKERLQKQIFKSVVGGWWYTKLRGFESDPFEYERGSFGRQYAMKEATADPAKLSAKLMKLCEGAGRKMRKAGYAAYGIRIVCLYTDHTLWHKGHKFHSEMYSLTELFQKAQLMLNYQPQWKPVRMLSVTFFDIVPSNKSQLTLFDLYDTKQREISEVMDRVNDKYGEYTLIPSRMMNMQDEAVDRIPFGGTNFIEDLYT